MLIRQAKLQDVQEVLHLWKSLMDEHMPLDGRFVLSEDALGRWRNDLWHWIEDPVHRVLVAEEEGRLVGFLHAFLWHDMPLFEQRQEVYLEDLYLDPSFRGQGHGKRMYEMLVSWAGEHDAQAIRLSTLAANPKSNAFWVHMGFEPIMVTYTRELQARPPSPPASERRPLGFTG